VREGGADGGDRVSGEGDQEELLAAEAVGEVTEEERADHRVGKIDCRGSGDLLVGQAEPRLALHNAGERADQRDFQAVKNPGGAERGEDAHMPAGPGRASMRAGRSVSISWLSWGAAALGMGSPFESATIRTRRQKVATRSRHADGIC
jgi:hypothetical protein